MNPNDNYNASNNLPVHRDNQMTQRMDQLSTEVRQDDKNDEFDIDIVTFWHTLVKRRWTIAGTAGLIFLALFGRGARTTHLYRE